MAIKKLALCWITVSDLGKSKIFFKDACGLDFLQKDSVEGLWLEFAGQQHDGLRLGVAQVEASKASKSTQDQKGANAVPIFVVDDIVAQKTLMEKNGVHFFGDIIEVPGNVKLATFVDLDNNTFQLAQEINS